MNIFFGIFKIFWLFLIDFKALISNMKVFGKIYSFCPYDQLDVGKIANFKADFNHEDDDKFGFFLAWYKDYTLFYTMRSLNLLISFTKVH